MLPVGAAAPGFAAGLARRGDRVELPRFLAGVHVVRRDEAAYAVFAATDADDDFVFDDQRRHRHRVAELGITDRRVPHGATGLCVDPDEVRVERAHEQRVAMDCNAAIVRAAADALVGRVVVVVDPEHAARFRVEGEHVVRPLRHVHDAVDDERRGFPRAEHLALQHPLILEIAYVLRSDLTQRAVPVAGVTAAIGEPVLRLLSGAENPFRRHVLRGDIRGEQHEGGHRYQRPEYAFHVHSPFNEIRYATRSAVSSGLKRSL